MNTCIYCHKPVLSNEAYSMRKMNGKDIYWHYLCYTKEAVQLVPLSVKSQQQLINYLVKNFPEPDGWVLEVLRGLGYGL